MMDMVHWSVFPVLKEIRKKKPLCCLFLEQLHLLFKIAWQKKKKIAWHIILIPELVCEQVLEVLPEL